MLARWTTLLFLLPLLCVAAKCVDADTIYRDSAGNLHIVGEIHNDTDQQGTDVVVAGTLFDGGGRVIATARTPICPFELSPHTFSTFDIAFPNSAALQPLRYEINVVSGTVELGRLPQLQAKLSTLRAHQSGDTVTVTGTLSADPGYEGRYYGCAAFYDSRGNVVRQLSMIGLGNLSRANVKQDLNLDLPGVPPGAIKMRFWVVGPGATPLTSNYRAIVTDFIVIQ